MSLDAVKNFGKVTVSGTYDANAFVIEVSDGTRFPNPAVSGQCNVVWYNDTDYPDPADDSNVEIVRVTAVSGNVVTLANNGTSRIAQEGTTTSTKNTASKTSKMFLGITAKMITDIQSQIITSISQLVLSAVGVVRYGSMFELIVIAGAVEFLTFNLIG